MNNNVSTIIGVKIYFSRVAYITIIYPEANRWILNKIIMPENAKENRQIDKSGCKNHMTEMSVHYCLNNVVANCLVNNVYYAQTYNCELD